MRPSSSTAALPEDALAPRPFAEIPARPGFPFFGNVIDVWRDPIALLTETARDFGDVARLRFGPYPVLFLNGVDEIHHVLVKNPKNYEKSRSYDGLKFVLGSGLLTSEGEHWKKQRRLAQPAFHHKRLAHLAAVMAGATRDLLERWSREEKAVDLHAEMMRLTFRIVGLTLFGRDVEGEAAEIGRAMETALRWADKYVEQVVRMPPRIPTPTNLRFRRALAVLDEFVYRLIDERRKSGVAGDDLLGMLLAATGDSANDRMSDRELRDEVMTLVLAGHETTANALLWTLCLLAKHPDVVAKLRSELAAELGDREPGFEDLPRLGYTERVLEESMRLFPPAYVIQRQAIEDDVIAGHVVPKGTTIVIAPYTLHRNPRYWENPESFDPDRFLSGREASRPQRAYLPFGDGPRVCIGKGFAMMEMKLALAMIVRAFDVRLAEEGDIPLYPGITLRPKGPVRVDLRARARQA